jgi:signal transduction histidine kinase
VFTRLRVKLALQFAALVFGLMLVLGAVFLAIEYTDVNRQLDRRLRDQAAFVQREIRLPMTAAQATRLHAAGINARIVAADGRVLYTSDIFARVHAPVSPAGLTTLRVDGSSFRVLTAALGSAGGAAVLQLAAQDILGPAELPGEIAVFFAVALSMTLLAALLGFYFAKRSLEPAQEMFLRLERFTHDASHELRTPLAVVGSELDLALRTRDYEVGIRAAKEELRHGSELVESLLDLASLDTAALEAHSFDISALVQREVDRYEAAAEAAAVTIHPEIAPSVRVRGSERLVAQLIDNLLGNAVKFSPGGVVTVSLTRGELRVGDTGPGIGEADLERVFERFYQADVSRSQQGHGLGLAIAKHIAEAHGWRIWAESLPGAGATFVVAWHGHHRVSRRRRTP